MALWKPFRGNRENLDSVAKHDGYIYFCTDDATLFFDYLDSNGNLQRKQINAKEAESLLGYSITTIINTSNTAIPTAGAVSTALAGKSDNGHKHTTTDVTGLQDALDGKASKTHDHTISANASDDDVVVLTGTSGTNGVTYSASHANSGVTAGTYKSVTVNAKGHVTAGTNPTTLSGYGITDAASKSELNALSTQVAGKADEDHDHAIADVTGLQDALNGKANSSHGTHVTYSTTAPKMDGTAAVGTASNVARGDHVHPTDTSRASQADLNALADVVDGKANASHGNHVPAVETANNAKFLRNDNTWQTVTPANIGAATSTHKHSASDITSGTLAIARGGTGATTAEDALKNLGIYIGPTEPTDPSVKIWINTSEEGTGVIPVLPRISTITLKASAWTGTAAPYKQAVTINTVTSATKVDLQPTASQMLALQNADISLMAENNNGVVNIYAFGGQPQSDMNLQVMLTEVAYV